MSPQPTPRYCLQGARENARCRAESRQCVSIWSSSIAANAAPSYGEDRRFESYLDYQFFTRLRIMDNALGYEPGDRSSILLGGSSFNSELTESG